MTKRNFFIFGAGFTKAVFENAPLNSELVNALLEFKPSSQLKSLSDKYLTNDIELLLTKLDIDIHQGGYKSEVRSEINANIAEYFQRFRFKPNMLNEKKWLEKFALKSFRRDDIIINLNYDCFLEGLLDYFGVWNPNKGYGAIHNVLIDDSCVNINNIQIQKSMVLRILQVNPSSINLRVPALPSSSTKIFFRNQQRIASLGLDLFQYLLGKIM